MKKTGSVILAAALLLSLCACGKKPPPFDPDTDAGALLDAGCFSEELIELPSELACATYGIDAATVTESAFYCSAGTTAEELAILVLRDADAARAALKQLQYRVEDRTEDMRNYLPAEVPKLEQAIVSLRGSSVLLLVANDYDPAAPILGE